jgi:selenide,water dikinase
VLRPLADLHGLADPDLLVGLSGPDDAAVYRLNERQAVVLTADFFPPVVDDAYTYGAIAAANAMSDVYAMGGEVRLALNLVAYPEDLPSEIVTEILRGAGEKLREGGGFVAGGHSVNDNEPKFGLCVLGLIDPDHIVRKGGAQVGDRLYLTKPIGTGLILSAAKSDRTTAEELDGAIAGMLELNMEASRLALAAGVHGMTDVTGFGLLGHALEMARASGTMFEFEAAAVPLLPGAVRFAESGMVTRTGNENITHLRAHLALGSSEPEKTLFTVLSDPQTSGGLLIALSDTDGEALEHAFEAAGRPLWRVGRVLEGEGIWIV